MTTHYTPPHPPSVPPVAGGRGARPAAARRGRAADGASTRRGRRRADLLPRGGAEGRPARAAAARVPVVVAHVPQPDPGAGGPVPRRRPGLPGLRPQRHARAGRVRLHLRPPGRRDRRVHGARRPRPLRALRPGLRRAGRLPARRPAPRAHPRARRPERQRLRRGAARVLEPDQGLLAGSDRGESRGAGEGARAREPRSWQYLAGCATAGARSAPTAG